jgi:hypothetical protein
MADLDFLGGFQEMTEAAQFEPPAPPAAAEPAAVQPPVKLWSSAAKMFAHEHPGDTLERHAEAKKSYQIKYAAYNKEFTQAYAAWAAAHPEEAARRDEAARVVAARKTESSRRVRAAEKAEKAKRHEGDSASSGAESVEPQAEPSISDLWRTLDLQSRNLQIVAGLMQQRMQRE